MSRYDDEQFEDEVRRIAWALWPQSENQGATKIGGLERDGVFITDDMVYLLECTTSRKQEKAQKDIDKLIKLADEIQRVYTNKGVK